MRPTDDEAMVGLLIRGIAAICCGSCWEAAAAAAGFFCGGLLLLLLLLLAEEGCEIACNPADHEHFLVDEGLWIQAVAT